MLILTPQQQIALGAQTQAHFAEALEQRVTRQWTEECSRLGAEQTRRVVQQAMSDAGQLGYDTELDVGRHVHLTFAFRTLHYHQQEWAAEFMAEAELPARIRMNRLFDAACHRLAGLEAGAAG